MSSTRQTSYSLIISLKDPFEEHLRPLVSNNRFWSSRELGMGRSWQISGRICLPCGKNLSSGHISKCGKNFENHKKLQRRRSAWVGQSDVGKLELNNRNHSGNCQRLSAKRDQCETQSIWNYRRQTFSDLRAFFVDGRGYYYSSTFLQQKLSTGEQFTSL